MNGTGKGKVWVCYPCSTPGHFARDCPQMSELDRATRARDGERAHARATRPQQRFDRLSHGGGTARGVGAGWS